MTDLANDLSLLRNAAREYSNAFNRWTKAPQGSERETRVYGEMVAKIETLTVAIVNHPAGTRERERALMQGLNHNKPAADFLITVMKDL